MSCDGGGRRDVLGEARAKGFKLLECGETEGARERFNYALRGNKRDADSLGGIGVILLQQNRFTEAEDCLLRAASRSKRSREKWGEALSSARYFGTYKQAKAALDQCNFPDVERIARGLPQRSGEDGKVVH